MLKKLFLPAIMMSQVFSLSQAVNAQDTKSQVLDDIVVTADSVSDDSKEIIQPTQSLEGDNLLKKMQTSIGSTLSQETGIHSSDYGPHVSRPIIRGLSNDQLIILQNGINHSDASSISADHNSAIDPLSLEKIDIIRGPASLIYSAKSVSGVVDLIDNRIPKHKIHEMVTGVVDGRVNSATKERSSSFILEGGIDDVSWHINGGLRKTSDMAIPSFARSQALRKSEPLEEGENEEYGRVNNSQSLAKNITLGISKHFNHGYLGVAYSHFENDYGILGHEHHHHEEEHEEEAHDDEEHHQQESNPILEMQQRRFDIAGAYHQSFSFIESIDYKLGATDYEHQEIEGDIVGTTFGNRGYDGRVEIKHKPTQYSKGLFGLQLSRNKFLSAGEEVFLPQTTTQNIAGFFLETFPINNHEIQLSARLDNQNISKQASSNFGNAETRRDITYSASLGNIIHLQQGYDVAFSASYNQKAPNSQELYSNGEHFATSSFDIGNPQLDVQKSIGFDISLKKIKGDLRGEVNLFYNNFQDYINQNPTGNVTAQEELPIFAYENIPARFYGAEIKTSYLVYDQNQKNVTLRFQGDYVNARHRETKEFLPRIPPLRLGVGADYDYYDYGMHLDTIQVFSQKNISSNETQTKGYTMLNLGLDYDLNFKKTSSIIYLQATNLLNQDTRNHVSFIKDNVPLAGRSFMLGLRTAF